MDRKSNSKKGVKHSRRLYFEDHNIHQMIVLGRTNKKKKINSRVSVVFLHGIPWRKHFGEHNSFNSFCNLLMNKEMEKEVAIFPAFVVF